MGSLAGRSLRLSLVAAAIVIALGLGASVVRLLPWLLAPEVPFEVAVPFARALGAAATETGFLLGLPVGCALAAAITVERGELRALESLGVSPLGLCASVAAHALGLGLLAALATTAWGSAADRPGRFARELVAQGRASCASASAPRSVTVPMVDVTWLCFPGSDPRVVAPLPGLGGRAWLSARDLVPSDDLREVALADLRIAARDEQGKPRLELRAGQGTVRGLPAWGRSAKLDRATRAALVWVTASGLCLAVLLAVLGGRRGARPRSLIVGGVPAVAAVVALHRLDSSAWPAAAHALAPVVGLAALGAVLLAERGLVAVVARTRAR